MTDFAAAKRGWQLAPALQWWLTGGGILPARARTVSMRMSWQAPSRPYRNIVAGSRAAA